MASRDLGNAAHIFAEAIGQPGQRRFRLQVIGEGGESASIWLEKEQLGALGEALDNVLRNEGYQYQRLPLDDVDAPALFPGAPDIDFRARELSLGLNRERQRVLLIAGPASDSDTVQWEVEYRRAHELRRQIADVVAAGRRECPLCHGPIDPDGHVCVRRNGHHAQP